MHTVCAQCRSVDVYIVGLSRRIDDACVLNIVIVDPVLLYAGQIITMDSLWHLDFEEFREIFIRLVLCAWLKTIKEGIIGSCSCKNAWLFAIYILRVRFVLSIHHNILLSFNNIIISTCFWQGSLEKKQDRKK